MAHHLARLLVEHPRRVLARARRGVAAFRRRERPDHRAHVEHRDLVRELPRRPLGARADLCGYGLYSDGLYSHGLYSDGLYSHGLYSDGLYSYGL